MRTTIGRVLSIVGVVFAAIGIFILEGIPIEVPKIISGGSATTLHSGLGIWQIPGIAAVVLCVISLIISGLEAPPQ